MMDGDSLTEAIAKIHGLTEDKAEVMERGKLIILPEEFQLYELRKQLNDLRIMNQGEPHLNDRRSRAIQEAQEIRKEIEGYGETPCR
jgi:hypothetical protein